MLKPTTRPLLRVGLLMTVSVAFGQTTGITTPYGTLLQLPPVGLAASETAQVNVVMTGVGGAATYCSGTIAFSSADAAGTVVGVSSFGLNPGQMFSASLPFVTASPSGQRTVIRAEITLSPWKVQTATGSQIATCSIASSLETYDTATGVTHTIITGSAAFNPPAAEARFSEAR